MESAGGGLSVPPPNPTGAVLVNHVVVIYGLVNMGFHVVVVVYCCLLPLVVRFRYPS